MSSGLYIKYEVKHGVVGLSNYNQLISAIIYYFKMPIFNDYNIRACTFDQETLCLFNSLVDILLGRWLDAFRGISDEIDCDIQGDVDGNILFGIRKVNYSKKERAVFGEILIDKLNSRVTRSLFNRDKLEIDVIIKNSWISIKDYSIQQFR